LVLHPHLKGAGASAPDPAERLQEAEGLARAINLNVATSEVVYIARPRPATLLGTGNVTRIADFIATAAVKGHENGNASITVVIVDGFLSPVQQRNLERAWNCKVIDRTGLILEIFGARARTSEGRLQVELAALTYQRSRLVRSWTHLERQRGGAGFMGGPGETQIESDRRLIDQRITSLRRKLKDVKRTRELHRKARKRVPYPVIALVGYTNAGKSTLFNSVTKAEVVVKDQLFATLDPTMRGFTLPSGRLGILSDTVGFISDLPHELVSAFSATLEEVQEADIIVHVRDAAHPDSESQRDEVHKVLCGLGLESAVEAGLVEALNKIDLLSAEQRSVLENRVARGNTEMVCVSAKTGEGIAVLLSVVDARITQSYQVLEVRVSPEEGRLLSWLYNHSEIAEREDSDTEIRLSVRISEADAARFGRMRANKDRALH